MSTMSFVPLIFSAGVGPLSRFHIWAVRPLLERVNTAKTMDFIPYVSSLRSSSAGDDAEAGSDDLIQWKKSIIPICYHLWGVWTLTFYVIYSLDHRYVRIIMTDFFQKGDSCNDKFSSLLQNYAEHSVCVICLFYYICPLQPSHCCRHGRRPAINPRYGCPISFQLGNIGSWFTLKEWTNFCR